MRHSDEDRGISNEWDEVDCLLAGTACLFDPHDVPDSDELHRAARHGATGTTAGRHGG
jgi:hypothetical protein